MNNGAGGENARARARGPRASAGFGRGLCASGSRGARERAHALAKTSADVTPINPKNGADVGQSSVSRTVVTSSVNIVGYLACVSLTNEV